MDIRDSIRQVFLSNKVEIDLPLEIVIDELVTLFNDQRNEPQVGDHGYYGGQQ